MFQNVSPPAAFVGPVDTSVSNSDAHAFLQEVDPILPPVVPRNVTKGANYPTMEPIKPVEDDEDLHITESPSSSEPPKTSRSRSSSTFGALQKWFTLGSSTESRGSISGSVNPPLKQQASTMMEASKSLVKERLTQAMSPKAAVQSPVTICSATQTSPEPVPESSLPLAVAFNIGSTDIAPPSMVICTSSHTGPKGDNKKRKTTSGTTITAVNKSRKERPVSPTRFASSNEAFAEIKFESPVKEAIGPGEAQSVRAVFGAVLWHSGIIHDAMACASYLRFVTKGKEEEEDEEEEDENVKPVSGVSVRATSFGVEEEESCNDEGETTVILRTKSPNFTPRRKQDRHSVEVTSAAWYVRGNPGVSLEPLKLPQGFEDEWYRIESNEDKDEECKGEDGNKNPPAMVALEKIWGYMRGQCGEALVKVTPPPPMGVTGTAMMDLKNMPVRMRKEIKKVTTGHKEQKSGRNRKEKPRHLHALGRSFLLGEGKKRIDTFKHFL